MNYLNLLYIVPLLWATIFSASSEKPGKLVWSEEFNYTGLPDSNIWTYDVGNGCPNLCGWGNQELQHYIKENPNNARVEDGKLIIEAHKGSDGRWTSARLKTQGKKSFQYGRIQFRAKLPTGSGTWPALWMLGNDITKTGWPRCGEIDIMEHVGKTHGTILSAIHTPSSHGDTQNKATTATNNVDSEWHVYEMRWTKKKLAFYVDGKKYYTYQPKVRNAETWPFDNEFFIIMNIAIGGGLGSEPQYETDGLKNGVDPELTTARMEVDYVRVYQ